MTERTKRTSAASRSLAARLPAPRRPPATSPLLGADHPFTRSLVRSRVLATQVAVVAAIAALAGIGIGTGRSWGLTLLAAALVVELGLALMTLHVRGRRHEQALLLIAEGHDGFRLVELAPEVRRLQHPRHARELVARLECALDQAHRWRRIGAFRPPQGVVRLRLCQPEVQMIVQRAGDRAPAPGLAALELFLTGGAGSTLYRGTTAELREQLQRIAELLR